MSFPLRAAARSYLQLMVVGVLSTLGTGMAVPPPGFAVTAPMTQVAVKPASVLARQGNTELQAGRTFYNAGRFAEAATAWKSAAQTYGEKDDYPNQALSLSFLSLAYQALRRLDSAEQAIDQSLELLQTAVTVDAILWAQVLNTQASLFLELGKAQNAIDTWQRSQGYYKQVGDISGVLGTQVNQAQAWQRLGFYRRSKQLLENITQRLATESDSAIKVSGLRSLGVALQVIGDLEASRDVLTQGLAIAQDLGFQSEMSSIFLSLGNTAVSAGDPNTALDYYLQAEQSATHGHQQLDARLNQLSLYAEFEEAEEAKRLIPHLKRQLIDLSPNRGSTYAVVNFAEQVLKLDQQPGNRVSAQDLGLERLLANTLATTQQLADPKAEAYVLGQLGQFYAQMNQPPEAAHFTQQALVIAQQLQTADMIYPLARQMGRIRVQQGRREMAIAAYTEATKALQLLRGDLVAINSDVQFSFRESVEPVYRELVALLLDGNPSQANLSQARRAMEALQLAELDNFFREACLDVEPMDLNQLDPNAAVIYPIILPDQLAVIVSLSNQSLRYYRIERSQMEVEQVFDQLLASFSPAYDNAARLRYSQQVYDWLIRPAETEQVLQPGQTLVFVLDGLLRDVPIAALYDGKQYLLEKYSVALSPGLQLLASRPDGARQFKAITAGMSQARPGFEALPAVETEVQQISQQVPGWVLLNQTFTSDKLSRAVTRNTAEIIHLATHFQYSSKVEDTFLLTWEGRLNVRDLTQLLTDRETARSGPIQLIVLSACQTAVGDDRAALGLAGFAVRSGARSTLATLWTVNDRSTAIFMTEFYQQLQKPNVTKAEALRRAQLTLLADRNYEDPFFWAPFVLVGNWL